MTMSPAARIVIGLALLALGLVTFESGHGTLAWIVYSSGALLIFSVLLSIIKRHGVDPYDIDREPEL